MAVPIDPTAQRRFAIEVVERLRAAGFVAYWAGGCVRDELLNRQPKDYDVATSATPDQIRRAFGEGRTLAIGAAFGVITVLGKKQAGAIEVATFRQDAAYSDGRHPDYVVFSTPEQDALRRDFTINGMFMDPETGQVLDFVGGQTDLLSEKKWIRAIGKPRERFAEDKLRMLRAVRFAVRFGFQIESETRAAIEEMASQVGAVSIERIVTELRIILLHPDRAHGLQLLDELGLLKAIMKKAGVNWQTQEDADDSRWPITLGVLTKLNEPSFPLALAALVHLLSPGEIGKLGANLKLSSAEGRRATRLVQGLNRVLTAVDMKWPDLQRLLVSAESAELLALAEAVAQTTGQGWAGIEACQVKLRLPPTELDPPLLLTGNDLVAHGVPPGPAYQWLLERVRDAQLENSVTTKDEALALVDKLRDAEGPESPPD